MTTGKFTYKGLEWRYEIHLDINHQTNFWYQKTDIYLKEKICSYFEDLDDTINENIVLMKIKIDKYLIKNRKEKLINLK